jgi:hypothetical protein
MGAEPRSVLDPDGREVVFDSGTQLHLALNHSWSLSIVDLILQTVESPDHRELDPIAGRERFYRRHVIDPWRWLRVVVDFGDRPGWIVTAFAQDFDPRRGQP